MKAKLYIIFFFAASLLSCTPAEKKDEVVDVINAGVFIPVEFEVIGGVERGEFLIGGQDHFVEVFLKNNSNYSLTEMNLIVDENSTAAMKFAPSENGATHSPGAGGSCSSELKPKKSCKYRILYKPTFPGNLEQNLNFSYKNLIEKVEISKTLKLLAGEAASLIFEGEKINYSFGVVERTEQSVYSNVLRVKNTGGLSAKNIVFSKFDAPATNAYTILSNTCPENISPGQVCEIRVNFTPQNYSPGAPDGNVEVSYTSNLKLDYLRDPEGGMSALTAYYSTLSTTIEGRIKSAGATSLQFNEITVGNIDEVNIKITNQGYKESIIHSLDIRDSLNNLVARCVNNSSSRLSCRDPLGDVLVSAELPLSTIPFKIVDLNDCLAKVEDLNYSWDTQGIISNTSIRQVGARTEELAGESCFFKIQFHPSVSFSTDGNFNDYRFNVRFDSTWKNAETIYNDSDLDNNNFNVSTANYLSAAKFEVSLFEYNKVPYPNLDTSDNSIFSYDLGRVSLITDSTYKKGLKFRVKNIGSTLGEIVSVKDQASTSHTITNTSALISTFYQNASHNCSYLAPTGGQCDLVMDLSPTASTNPNATLAQQEENNLMYDIQNSSIDRYKSFVVTYRDGTTYNDDMTLRQPLTLNSRLTGLLVRKGSLVFADASMTGGVSTANSFVSGNIGFYYLVLRNVGTGGITHIEVDTELPGMPGGYTPVSSTFPYAYYDEPMLTGRSTADFDCYDIVSFKGSVPITPTDGSVNSSTVLDAGKSCSLTIAYKLKNNDKNFLASSPSHTQAWEYLFNLDHKDTIESWEFINYIGSEFPIQLKYFDGDGVVDIGTGYTPGVLGYGNEFLLDQYNLKPRFYRAARLKPQKPSPIISAILWRQGFTLPAYSISGSEWGSNLSAVNVPQKFMDNSVYTANTPVAYRTASVTNFSNKGYADTNVDYIYHGGTYKAGKTYQLSFQVKNFGQVSATGISSTISGDSEFAITQGFTSTLGANSVRSIIVNFTPTSAGSFSTDLEVKYKSGRRDLTDAVNLTYSNWEETQVIRIVADAVDSTSGEFEITSQDYEVNYDPNTTTYTETLQAPIKTYSYKYDNYNTDSNQKAAFKAIRGSLVYALKKFDFKNIGSTAIEQMNFFIKTGVEAYTTQNTGSGVGYKIDSNTCTGTLNPGATCSVEIYFKASSSEPTQTLRYAFMTYKIDDNQYRSIGYLLEFNAADPAKLKVGTINPINIYNEVGGIIQNSYGISFGQYSDASHPILAGYPNGTLVKTQNITNISSEKASFLKQYRLYVGNSTATLPAGANHIVYDNGKIKVELSRPCFYGDDEGGGLPEDQWGFNSSTTGTCSMKIYYTFDDTYIGGKINTAFNYAQLAFYDNLRASSSFLTLHAEGFIEPNLSAATSTILRNVTADSSGTIHLEWDPLVAQNEDWGAVEGYRVFYSTTTSVYSNIYEATGVPFEDVGATELTVTGLVPGKYYYFLVTALRTTQSGKQYFSLANNFSYKEIVVPPVGAIYDYENKAIIDKFQSPEGNPTYGTKAQAAANCAGKVRVLSKNGANVNKYKSLINYSMYEFINSDEAGHSDYNYKISPHWLADPAVDIATIFITNFDCSQLSGSEPGNLYYQKSCNDCSCNNLSSVIGGDGGELPYAGHLFVEDSFTGSARCYVPQ